MNRIDILRNRIIDKLLTISDKDYLLALSKLVENSSVDSNSMKLSEEQILMLQLSDRDIEAGKKAGVTPILIEENSDMNKILHLIK